MFKLNNINLKNLELYENEPYMTGTFERTIDDYQAYHSKGLNHFCGTEENFKKI